MNFLSYWVRGTLLLLALVLAVIGVLSITRSTPVRTVIAPGVGNQPPAVGDSAFGRVMELYTGTHLKTGNRVQVLLNGNGTYPVFWDDLRNARQSILFQMYFAEPGTVTDSVCAILVRKAREGVRVAVVLDAFGAGTLRRTDFVQTLRDAGAFVAWLRPIHWYSLNRAATRSHARAVIIDGRVGYTGGFGLADYWLGDGVQPGQWRETNVRFEGPAVAELQMSFIASWAEATGVLLASADLFPERMFAERGTVRAGLMHTTPGVGSTAAERYIALSIAGARKRLYITNSYFVPDIDFRRLLMDAVKRGVDVRVLTAGPRTDVKTTWYAGRSYYEELLAAGVRIYEYQPVMMHAKTLVADGMWVSIGSMNFDNRSVTFNNETNLVAIDTALGAEMERVFRDDLTHAHEMTLPEFRTRGVVEKAIEWSAQKLWRVL